MKRLLMGLITLSSACSTQAADTGLYVVQGMDLDAAAALADCGCFWQGYGYASETACRGDRVVSLTSEQESCVISVGDHFPEFEAQAQCRLRVAAARRDCYQPYIAACTVSGFDACDDARDAAFLACAGPCDDLAGTARTDCETRRAQLQSESVNCF